MAVELIDILVQWLQNVALLLKQNVELPSYFDYVRRFYNVILNFDVNGVPLLDYLYVIEKYTSIDFRIQYLIVNIIVPLLTTLITLLLFERVYVILWYFLILLGIMCIVVGCFAFILPQQSYSLFMSKIWVGDLNFPLPPQVILILFGLGLVLICLLFGLTIFACNMINKQIKFRRTRKIMDINAVKSRMSEVNSPKGKKGKKKEKQKKGKRGRKGPVIKKRRIWNEAEKPTEEMVELNIERKQVLQFSITRTFVNMLCVILMIFGGGVLLQIIKLEYFGWKNNIIDTTFSDNSIRPFAQLFGVICVIAGLVTFFQTSLSCCAFGRKLEYNVVKCCKHNMLKLILMLLTLLYTPIVTSLFSSFMCNNYSCDPGFEFPISYSSFSLDTVLAEQEIDNITTICRKCSFHPNCNCTIEDQLCPGVTQYQLIAQANIECTSEMTFFWPATAILTVTFVIGVPIFFFILTARSSRKLRNMNIDFLLDRYVPLWIRNQKKSKKLTKKAEKEDKQIIEEKKENKLLNILLKKKKKLPTDMEFTFPVSPPELVVRMENEKKNKRIIRKNRTTTGRERWIIRTALTKNPAKSLYQSFESRWRYFRMMNIVVKLILVCSSICLIQIPKVSIPITLLINLILGFLLIVTFPYLDWTEDVLSITVALITCMNAGYLFTGLWVKLPEWTFYPVVLINGIVPLLAVVLLLWSCISRRRSSSKYKKLIQKLHKLQKVEKINIQKRVDYNKVRNNLRDTDELLTSDSMKCVLIFFMFLGVTTFVALACVVLGLLYTEFNPKFIPNNYDLAKYSSDPGSCKNVYTNDFAGYLSWEEFTENCCCSQTDHYANAAFNNHYQEVEMWQCKNKKRKERVRVLKLENKLVNGTIVRGFCSKEFNPPFFLSIPCFNGTAAYANVVGGTGMLNTDSIETDEFNIRKYYW